MSYLKTKKILNILIFIFLYFPSIIYSLGTNENNGLLYLFSTQNTIGVWENSNSINSFATTIETILTLEYLSEKTNTHYISAVQWLNSQSLETTSELSMRLLVSPTNTADRDLLLSYFDPYGSAWGGHKYFENNALDTAMAVLALKHINSGDPYVNDIIGRGVVYLKGCQKADGGWGFTVTDDSDVTVSAIVLDALAKNSNTTLQASIGLGVQYLLSRQHDDGGFGTGAESTVYDTALSFVALQDSHAEMAGAALKTQNYLASAQQSDGSWNHDAYETALALRVLNRIQANLTGTAVDINFAPSMPRSGQLTGITATIHNTGCVDASNVRVRFYDNDPAAGGVQIGSDQTLASLGAGQQADVTITHSFTGMGEQTVFVQIDPENTVQEYNENDNIFSKRLWIATGPDLTASTGDLRLSTSAPKPGEAFVFEYDVRNVGESGAGPFTCALYDGNPSSGGSLLTTSILSGVPGASKRTGTFGITLNNTGRHTLYLVIDSENQVAEISETNNTAMIAVTVGGVLDSADLVIGSGAIHVDPARPTTGQTVAVTVKVSNYGTVSAQQAKIELFDGNPSSGGTLIQSALMDLEPGQRKTLSASWAVPAGKHVLYAVADRAGVIPETDETNNSTSTALMTNMVDIVLSSSDLNVTPSYPVAGDSVALTVTARNTGISPTGAFTLKLYDGIPGSGGNLIQTFAMASIAGDNSFTVMFNFTAESRTYRFYAVADPENQVAELSDDNNTAMKTMIIKAAGETFGADLKVVKMDTLTVATDPLSLAVSGIAKVTFQNIGDVKVTTPFTVCVYEDSNRDGFYTPGVDKALGQTETSQALMPNGVFMVPVTLNGTVSFKGNLLSVMVDLTDTIVETNEDNNTLTTGADCEDRPENPIQPVVEWSWKQPSFSYNISRINTPPAIVSLVDTNGDGRVDEKDIPYLVFNMIPNDYNTYLKYYGELRAIKGDGSSELFTAFNDATHINWQGNVAAGDIDNDGYPEIITNTRSIIGVGTTLIAYNHDGTFKWENSEYIKAWNDASTFYDVSIQEDTKPILADLDGDGKVEIISGGGANVFNSDGSVKSSVYQRERNVAIRATEIVVDLDLDGKPDILTGTTAYNWDGSLKWQMNPALMYGFTAIGNLDDDPYPEIAIYDGSAYIQPAGLRLHVYEHDGTQKWVSVNLTQFEGVSTRYEGQFPIIADFDGDGLNEIGVRGMNTYFIFDRQGNIKTQLHLHSHQSGTQWGENGAPTVFDLNGDGRPEVLIKGNGYFHIFDGKEGNLIFEDPFGESTHNNLANQSVIVADLDGDDHAEIFVMGFDSTKGECFRVYGSRNNDWVNARRVWNQSSYHISNIGDNGSIPRHEAPSWLTHNTYRCQLPVGETQNPYLTPNLTASLLKAVDGQNGLTLTVRVGNGGAIPAEPNVGVAFYQGDASGSLIGTVATTRPLSPGEYQDVQLVWAVAQGTDIKITAVVDPDDVISECHEEDNIQQLDYTLSAHLPDLSVVSDDIHLPEGPLSDGDVVNVTAVVHNKGAGTAQNVAVNLYNGNPDLGGKIVGETRTVATMVPGSSETLTDRKSVV
jgi:subtilase family serine protease